MAGIILGALGGAGQELTKVGGRMQQGAIDADLENLRSENLQNRTIALEKIREEAGIRAEDRGLMNRAKERGLIVDETLANKPRLTAAEIEATNAKESAALDFYGKNKDAVLGKKRDEAAAGRNPMEDRVVNLKLQTAQLELDAKKLEAKMPTAVKTRAESLRDEIKTINNAIAKAQAENMFDANSDNAKDLLNRYTTKAGQLDQLLSPYYGDKGPSKHQDQPPSGPWEKYGKKTAQDVKQDPGVNPVAQAEKKTGLISSPPAEPKQKTVLENIKSENMAALQSLAEQFKQAEREYLVAARSGDSNAIGLHMQKKEAVRKQLEQQVRAKFGNQTDRVLQQLYAQ